MSSIDDNRPFHVLMTMNTATRLEVKDRRIANDYLARRASAYNTPLSDVWSGVFPIERAFAECCELDGDESLYVVVEGALMLKKVMLFVELMAKYCYKATTRVLVIAILERTLEQDQLNLLEENVDDESKKQRPNCFSRFLAAGGLKILNQWFLDAMTPIIVHTNLPVTKRLKTSTHNPDNAEEMVPSSSGPLLMPLLEILERMPVDKALITSTKINKSIRRLDKQLADLPKKATDARAGGYVVEDVLNAVEALKNAWRIERPASEGLAKDPFRKLQQTMTKRLQELEEYDAGRTKEKPDWLSRFESVEKLAKDKKDFLKLTPEEREHKVALLNIQRKREETTKKMEELLVKKRKASSQSQKPKKTLRWKDGKDQGKGMQMQDVFYYPPEFDPTNLKPQETPEDFGDVDDNDDEDMWS